MDVESREKRAPSLEAHHTRPRPYYVLTTSWQNGRMQYECVEHSGNVVLTQYGPCRTWRGLGERDGRGRSLNMLKTNVVRTCWK